MTDEEFLQKFLDSDLDSGRILDNFLYSEINSKEMYEEMIRFIDSYEIRKGEFEGNEFIIQKLDRKNFIIYPEHVYPDGRTEIPYSLAIYGNLLKQAINDHALKQGII